MTKGKGSWLVERREWIRCGRERAGGGRGNATSEGVCGSGKRHPPREGVSVCGYVYGCTAAPGGFPSSLAGAQSSNPVLLASSVAHRRDDDTVAPLRHSDVAVTGASPRVNTLLLLS